MDKELIWRKPGEVSHWKVIGTEVMDSKLFLKIDQGEESMDRIETFLVFPVTALHLAVLSGCVRTEGKAVRKFKAVISLDTLDMNSPACIPSHQPSQEVRRGVGRLLSWRTHQ